MNRAPVSAQRGFTLIELLVAVTILAVVAVLGWRGLDAVARSRDDASRAFTTSSRLADGMQQFGDDLRHAVSQGPGLPAVSVLGGGLFIVRRLPGVVSMQIQFYRYAGIGLLQQSGAWVNAGTAANAANASSNTPAASASAAAAAANTLAASATTPAAVRLQLQFADKLLTGDLQRDFLLDDRE